MLRQLLKQVLPFLWLCAVIVIGIVGFVIFSGLILWAIVIGSVLMLIGWVRYILIMQKYKNTQGQPPKPDESSSGRTFDYDKLSKD